MESAAKGAVRSRGFRNTFNILDKPSQELVGDINHHFQGFLYPGTEPVKADLTGLLDGVPEEIGKRILLAVEEAHGVNLGRAKLLDRKVQTLANAASSLANTTTEALGMPGSSRPWMPGSCKFCAATQGTLSGRRLWSLN